MSRNQSRLRTMIGAGIAAASLAASAVGSVVAPKPTGPDALPPTKPVRRRKSPKARRVLAWARGEHYRQPNRAREIARRLRQIRAGQLVPWTPPPAPVEPIPEVGVAEAVDAALAKPKPARKPRAPRKPKVKDEANGTA